MHVGDKVRWLAKYQTAQSEMGKDGQLMFVIHARVYPSTTCALTNWSMNSVFLTLFHSFHSIGMCRMRRFLAVLRSFFHSSLLYTFSCHPSPPTILPFSLHLPIYFLVYLSFLLFPNSYIIFLTFMGWCIMIYFQSKSTWNCMYSLGLLIMDGETVWNM